MGGFIPKTPGAMPKFSAPSKPSRPPSSPPPGGGGSGSGRDAERAALRERMRNASGDSLARLSDQYNALNFKK